MSVVIPDNTLQSTKMTEDELRLEIASMTQTGKNQ
jgi:hypothetical protein